MNRGRGRGGEDSLTVTIGGDRTDCSCTAVTAVLHDNLLCFTLRLERQK